MANTKQARKRARQAVARNQHLSAQRSQYRTAIKAVRKLIVAGDKTAAAEARWPVRAFCTRTPLLVIRAAWLLLSRQWPNSQVSEKRTGLVLNQSRFCLLLQNTPIH